METTFVNLIHQEVFDITVEKQRYLIKKYLERNKRHIYV